MRVDELATWFESSEEVINYLKDLKALMQGKKIIYMRIADEEGSIELHFKCCVVTVKIEHVSFIEKVRENDLS